MATSFADLDFDDPSVPKNFGIRARAFYPNGYGVSVVQSQYSYGGDRGLCELAVLAGAADNSDLCYDTPITEDVEGYLTPDAVTELMKQVAALPARVIA